MIPFGLGDPKDRTLFLRIGVEHPVTIADRVTGREVAKPVFAEVRSYDFSQPVPESVLTSPVTVDLDITPRTRFGIMIAAVGLMKTR